MPSSSPPQHISNPREENRLTHALATLAALEVSVYDIQQEQQLLDDLVDISKKAQIKDYDEGF